MISINATVIIVSRDRKGLLRRAIEAVMAQDMGRDSYELIVVDDGSSDGTIELLKALKKKYKNFNYFTQEKKGPAAGRNLGIKNSKGEIIAFTDNDAIAGKSWLKNLLLPFSGKEVIAVEGKIIADGKKALFYNAPECLSGGKFMTCNMAFRKSVLGKIGGFDESMVFWREDADLSFRAMDFGRIVFSENAVVRHPMRRVSYLSLLKNLAFVKNDLLLFRRFPGKYREFFGFPFKKELAFSLLSWLAILLFMYSASTAEYSFAASSLIFALLLSSLPAFGKAFSIADFLALIPLSFLRNIIFPFFLLYYSAVVLFSKREGVFYNVAG